MSTSDHSSQAAALSVRVIGEMRCCCDGETVALGPQAQGLIAWLAINEGPQRRAAAKAALLPGPGDRDTRLRQLIVELRRELGDEYFPRGRGVIELARRPGVAIDYDEFRGLLDTDDPDPRLSLILLNGTLLEGMDAPWIDVARRTHADLSQQRLEHVIRSQLGAHREGTGPVAVVLAQLWVARAPDSQLAARALMLAWRARGEDDRALAEYYRIDGLLRARSPDPTRRIGASQQTRGVVADLLGDELAPTSVRGEPHRASRGRRGR